MINVNNIPECSLNCRKRGFGLFLYFCSGLKEYDEDIVGIDGGAFDFVKLL